MTITFFAPQPSHTYAERADSRVRVVKHDEATRLSTVVFTDGFRLVVRDIDLVTREV